MHNESNSQLPGEGQVTAPAGDVLSSQALSRRRALIKGLGKGGAAVAAVAPIQSYALGSFASPRSCSVSGIGSGVTSHRPDGMKNCVGWAPTHFYSLKHGEALNWPQELAAQSKTLKFNNLFTDSSSELVLNVLLGLPSDDPVRRIWVTAYFNALIATRDAGMDQAKSLFPLKASEVAAKWSTSEREKLTDFFVAICTQL